MPRFEIAALTDVGRARSRNEDAVAVDEDRGLVVVADGMGGHPAGDRASALAVETVLQRLVAATPTAASGEASSAGKGRSPPEPGEAMAEAVDAAHRRILEDGREHPERQGMGTTLTALRMAPDGDSFLIGHVGDSRAYLFREGALRPVTRDHTPLQEMVEAGELSREEARLHPMSHMLSQALGTADRVEPQVARGDVRADDVHLLCTDGLLAVLSDNGIETVLRETLDGPLDEAASALMERALEGGAPDNVTVGLLRVGAAPRGAADDGPTPGAEPGRE